MDSYGPFHRKKSSSQTYEDVQLQISSRELWGRAIKNGGLFPYVKGYLKPLCWGLPPGEDCVDSEGIEFVTAVKPSVKMPTGQVLWGAKGRAVPGIRKVDDETIALTVTILKVVYLEERSHENPDEHP